MKNKILFVILIFVIGIMNAYADVDYSIELNPSEQFKPKSGGGPGDDRLYPVGGIIGVRMTLVDSKGNRVANTPSVSYIGKNAYYSKATGNKASGFWYTKSLDKIEVLKDKFTTEYWIDPKTANGMTHDAWSAVESFDEFTGFNSTYIMDGTIMAEYNWDTIKAYFNDLIINKNETELKRLLKKDFNYTVTDESTLYNYFILVEPMVTYGTEDETGHDFDLRFATMTELAYMVKQAQSGAYSNSNKLSRYKLLNSMPNYMYAARLTYGNVTFTGLTSVNTKSIVTIEELLNHSTAGVGIVWLGSIAPEKDTCIDFQNTTLGTADLTVQKNESNKETCCSYFKTKLAPNNKITDEYKTFVSRHPECITCTASDTANNPTCVYTIPEEVTCETCSTSIDGSYSTYSNANATIQHTTTSSVGNDEDSRRTCVQKISVGETDTSSSNVFTKAINPQNSSCKIVCEEKATVVFPKMLTGFKEYYIEWPTATGTNYFGTNMKVRDVLTCYASYDPKKLNPNKSSYIADFNNCISWVNTIQSGTYTEDNIKSNVKFDVAIDGKFTIPYDSGKNYSTTINLEKYSKGNIDVNKSLDTISLSNSSNYVSIYDQLTKLKITITQEAYYKLGNGSYFYSSDGTYYKDSPSTSYYDYKKGVIPIESNTGKITINANEVGSTISKMPASTTYSCNYNGKEEECTGDYCDGRPKVIAYRIIDLDNPFPGKDATSKATTKCTKSSSDTIGRTPGGNWLDLVSGNYCSIVNEKIFKNRDVTTYQVYNTEPLYDIVLNSTQIKNIKADIKSGLIKYDDITDLTCEVGTKEYCISDFLHNSDYLTLSGLCETVNAGNKTTCFGG